MILIIFSLNIFLCLLFKEFRYLYYICIVFICDQLGIFIIFFIVCKKYFLIIKMNKWFFGILSFVIIFVYGKVYILLFFIYFLIIIENKIQRIFDEKYGNDICIYIFYFSIVSEYNYFIYLLFCYFIVDLVFIYVFIYVKLLIYIYYEVFFVQFMFLVWYYYLLINLNIFNI